MKKKYPFSLAPLQVMFLLDCRIRGVVNLDQPQYRYMSVAKLERERLVEHAGGGLFLRRLTEKGQRYIEKLCREVSP